MKTSFLLLGLVWAICTSAAPYIVTQHVEISVYTYQGYTASYTTESDSLYTYTKTVEPADATITNAITTITDTTSYDQVTVVEVLLPPGSGKTSSNDDDYYSSTAYTSWVIPITYLPNATCTSQTWTYSTNIPISVPPLVQKLLTPSLSAASSVETDYNGRLTTRSFQYAIMNPTDVPEADIAFWSSYYEPYGIRYCYTPTTYCATPARTSASCTPTFVYDSSSSSYRSGSTSYYGSNYNEQYWLTSVILICVLVPVGWFVLWFFIGLWENWMSFKGVMLGKQRKRGMPYSFCCISFLFLCWVGPTYKAKTEQEQADLKAKWAEYGAGRKIKLWLKWGFRWKYPDCIGEEPEKDRRALRQRCL